MALRANDAYFIRLQNRVSTDELVVWLLRFACQQEGVVKIERVVEVCYLWGIIPTVEKSQGKSARCDFCQTPVEEVRDWRGFHLDDWSPEEGLATLLTCLEIPIPATLPERTTDARLHALLTSVEKASATTRIELSPFGAGAGALACAILAIPLGMWLYENKFVQPQVDETGFVILSSIVGFVAGLVLGATMELLLRQPRLAHAMIEAAHTKYHVDLERLEELSRTYGKRTRKAVKKACAKVTLRN